MAAAGAVAVALIVGVPYALLGGAQEQPSVAGDAVAGDALAPLDPAADIAVADAVGENEASAGPEDKTLYVTVPKLGLRDSPVLDDDSEEAMEKGANHLPQTGYPWEEGANTYISGHRIGFPGTGSDRIFYDLPKLAEGDEVLLKDGEGVRYEYRVSEILEVSPEDVWVANPVPGRDVVSLQTCIEDFGDLWAQGPDWKARYVVRADRVDGGEGESPWGL